MEAKVNYIVKILGRPLLNEKSFPLLLHFNYTTVIKPRFELLRERVKYFEFEEVLGLTDEQFCLTYSIPMEELEKKKAERTYREEKDKLWAYVPGLWMLFIIRIRLKLLMSAFK